ncbi:MAG: hypothetical protein K8T90_09650 [Planctomycetes bacterium]|nr:hypothetical protein [Planctomycetota bacterium]
MSEGPLGRSVTSLIHLTGDEVRALASSVTAPTPIVPPLARKVVAVLPFGVSDPPRAAWVAAAGRLGATVIRESDLAGPGESSAEPLAVAADAARWADVLVTSHPLAGFARAVADLTGKPVVNAGESGGESPADGIALLASAWHAGPPIFGRRLRAAVCGDLSESRAARGFLAALAAVDATVLLVPARGRELSEDDVQRFARRLGRSPLRFEAHAMASLLDMVDTVLLGHDASAQLPLFREVGVPPDEAARRARRDVEDLDVLFVASSDGGTGRVVREPFRGSSARLSHGDEHTTPLRAFEVVLEFAGSAPPPGGGVATPGAPPAVPPAEVQRYRSGMGLTCHGDRCFAAKHRDSVLPDFAIVSRVPCILECLYCGARTEARFAASKVERRFHGLGSADASKIFDANLVLFHARGEALAAAFQPGRRRAPTEEDSA